MQVGGRGIRIDEDDVGGRGGSVDDGETRVSEEGTGGGCLVRSADDEDFGAQTFYLGSFSTYTIAIQVFPAGVKSLH